MQRLHQRQGVAPTAKGPEQFLTHSSVSPICTFTVTPASADIASITSVTSGTLPKRPSIGGAVPTGTPSAFTF